MANREWRMGKDGEWRMVKDGEQRVASRELKNGEWWGIVGAQRCCTPSGRDSLPHEQIAGWSLPRLLIVPPLWE
jgi:hypothetical protein